jgi:hypothetical protein
MTDNEIWARCQECGTELKQSDECCPKCSSSKKAYFREAIVSINLSASSKVVQKRKGFKRPLIESISNRWKSSGDPKLKNGVREDLIIDRQKNEYHQVVREAKTGEITHEEHQPLREHGKEVPNPTSSGD